MPTPAHDSSRSQDDPSTWLTYDERDIYSSEYVSLSLMNVAPPHGEPFQHHVVSMKPAAITAILNEENSHVALMWRHRFASDIWNWELPGGLVDDGEEPVETARREIREELGFSVRNLRHLVTFEPVIGMARAPHHICAASGYDVIAEPTELNEMQRMEWVPLTEVTALISAGQIKNSGTLVALLHVLAIGSG